MDHYSRFNADMRKVEVGVSIVVNAWGKFPSKTLKCIGIEHDEKHQANKFVFDSGVEWSAAGLASNFALWESRNGYQIVEAMDLTSFVLVGNNRKEAYESHIEFEKGFNDPDNPYLKMSFKSFCRELAKGYGKSDYVQISRLYEAPDGKVWYDNEYCA